MLRRVLLFSLAAVAAYVLLFGIVDPPATSPPDAGPQHTPLPTNPMPPATQRALPFSPRPTPKPTPPDRKPHENLPPNPEQPGSEVVFDERIVAKPVFETLPQWHPDPEPDLASDDWGVYTNAVPQNSKVAFVTFLGSNNYVSGAQVVMESLAIAGAVQDRVVMYTSNVSPRLLAPFEAAGIRTLLVQEVENPSSLEQFHHISYASARYRVTFTKLRIWGMHDYQRVVIIDNDEIVLRPLGHLFLTPTPAAVMSLGVVNPSLMVITPDRREAAYMIYLSQGVVKSFDGGELGFLIQYWGPKYHHLPPEDNWNLHECHLPDKVNAIHMFSFMSVRRRARAADKSWVRVPPPLSLARQEDMPPLRRFNQARGDRLYRCRMAGTNRFWESLHRFWSHLPMPEGPRPLNFAARLGLAGIWSSPSLQLYVRHNADRPILIGHIPDADTRFVAQGHFVMDTVFLDVFLLGTKEHIPLVLAVSVSEAGVPTLSVQYDPTSTFTDHFPARQDWVRPPDHLLTEFELSGPWSGEDQCRPHWIFESGSNVLAFTMSASEPGKVTDMAIFRQGHGQALHGTYIYQISRGSATALGPAAYRLSDAGTFFNTLSPEMATMSQSLSRSSTVDCPSPAPLKGKAVVDLLESLPPPSLGQTIPDISGEWYGCIRCRRQVPARKEVRLQIIQEGNRLTVIDFFESDPLGAHASFGTGYVHMSYPEPVVILEWYEYSRPTADHPDLWGGLKGIGHPEGEGFAHWHYMVHDRELMVLNLRQGKMSDNQLYFPSSVRLFRRAGAPTDTFEHVPDATLLASGRWKCGNGASFYMRFNGETALVVYDDNWFGWAELVGSTHVRVWLRSGADVVAGLFGLPSPDLIRVAAGAGPASGAGGGLWAEGEECRLQPEE